MDREDIILVSSGESENEEYVDRRAVFEPAIRSVVDALGGVEGGAYRLGDECYGCLKDLKKYWRKDDTDDERTVARIFYETRLLPNDLVPILLETAGKGLVEDKRAVACADLMTAMTWPIDMAEELKELDEEFDKGTDYTQLLFSHLNYKAALLKPGVMQALFAIMLPCLAKTAKERKERDVQIINVVLYLIRNLAFIKDLPSNTYLSADQVEYSSLQSRLIKVLSETHTLDLLLTIASNASDALFNGWNALVLEIFYLLFRGIKSASLAMDQAKQPAQDLQRLLAVEDRRKRDFARKANSRHSRFGTTISVTLNPKKAKPTDQNAEQTGDANSSGTSQAYVLHRQQAISKEAGSVLDMVSAKRHRAQKGAKIDELGRDDNLSLDARMTLQKLARTFIESCFNPLLSSLLKDIKAERPKITEKDNLRLLYVTKWFVEFFLCVRAKDGKESPWGFGLVAEVTDRQWIVWVLRRMREAVEEKPKLWTELQAGIECLTQFVLVIDSMSSYATDPAMADAAEVLQQQIIYNGEVLDISFESLRSYKDGTQSLAYLDSSVHLGYALLKMLEKWGKKRGGTSKNNEEDGIPDVEEEEDDHEEVIHETMFTFDMFESRFAHPDITHTLLTYLARYKEFNSHENMKRVVSLIHRQAVRAEAEGLFFNVSALDLFKHILSERSLPKDQPYKDLIALINFILRKFFKAVAEDSFLIVEVGSASFHSTMLSVSERIIQAFFPKNRGQWKHYSSWAPEEKDSKAPRVVEDTGFPPDVQVKKGYSWSEQLGIAIACLVEDGKVELIEWVKQILSLIIGDRQRTIEDTDGSSSKDVDDEFQANDDEEDVEAIKNLRGPSSEALAKISDYMIPYVSDEEANAATKDPYLKLVFRLVHFHILDEDADELEWYIPAAILPSDMQRSLNVINQFLETPLDLQGKKASQLLGKKRRRRTRRRRSPSLSEDGNESDDAPRKKREKKTKEKQQYKSAQFIEDSDAEYGDMEAFLEKEKALREKTALAAAATGQVATMKATGTKKRRRKNKENARGKKKQKRGGKAEDPSEEEREGGSQSDASEQNLFGSPKRPNSTSALEGGADESQPIPRPRPRPRPRFRKPLPSNDSSPSPPDPRPGSLGSSAIDDEASRSVSPLEKVVSDEELSSSIGMTGVTRKKGRLQLVTSDDD
ncbi:Topoisomerase 1-associated factor 1 [Grifola frondosa]|uniref:Topoisomerase 1-associated factor 1 n=1 Tax=Grifola frondosa TaxID=5627 RepID=A0A1C7MJP6_GRIFR|nr:Topoisomerase 1-associated factor 1 [Grifola frondosa]